MTSGEREGLTFKKMELTVPSLEEVRDVLQKGLKQNFETIDVSIVKCPDLRQKPFNLAHSGLCGNEKIADVGGPPYLIPFPQRDKIYSFKDIASVLGMGDNAFLLGAGAGPFHVVDTCCELMPNISFEKNQTNQTLINNRTHFAKVSKCLFQLNIKSLTIISLNYIILDVNYKDLFVNLLKYFNVSNFFMIFFLLALKN
jgi:hypothetical protein